MHENDEACVVLEEDGQWRHVITGDIKSWRNETYGIKESMTEGTLNIDYHIKRLMMIAKGKYKTEKEQAEALGISTTTLWKYKKKYNV